MEETGETTQLNNIADVPALIDQRIDQRIRPPYYGMSRERQLVTWATLEWHLEDERHRVVALERLVQELQQLWPVRAARWWAANQYAVFGMLLLLTLVAVGFIAGWTARGA